MFSKMSRLGFIKFVTSDIDGTKSNYGNDLIEGVFSQKFKTRRQLLSHTLTQDWATNDPKKLLFRLSTQVELRKKEKAVTSKIVTKYSLQKFQPSKNGL